MSIFRKLRRALRGEVSPRTAVWETVRRSNAAMRKKRERGDLPEQGKRAARLAPGFASLSPATLLQHFKQRNEPCFFPGFDSSDAIDASTSPLFADDSAEVLAAADRIISERSWPLFGNANHQFIDWHRDPFSGYDWPLDFYGDIQLLRNDGSDVRVVWELNRLGHLLTLARAFSRSGEQRFSEEFFREVESWDSRNPFGHGVNWNCAMEVALRAINLLGAFAVFRRAPDLDDEKLAQLLRIFEQHGKFIYDHLEFSYVATSNHYLSNVAGLLWLGIMLPELAEAAAWKSFGLRELLREMDKQILPDGANYESSTGYHRLVLELFCYSFVLCRLNGVAIEERYWQKLQQMFRYLNAYLRPDGYAPLLGDTDSGRVFPICHRRGDDHGYLLALGAVLFADSQLKDDRPKVAPELLWLLGAHGVGKYQTLTANNSGVASQQFPDAGISVLRDADLFLLFNASGAGLNGRGSHGHNDALSIEVSACGRPFIVDPGTYVYTADLHQRHLFRSTAYHSTVEVDGLDQNSTLEEMPFVIGNEAAPQIQDFDLGSEIEAVTAQHYGYRRLPQPVTHLRRVVFNKERRFWSLLDKFSGEGDHDLAFRFHFAPGLEVQVESHNFLGDAWPESHIVRVLDKSTGARLLIAADQVNGLYSQQPELEDRFSSLDYGAKASSQSVRWSLRTDLPFAFSFMIVPVCNEEDEMARFSSAMSWED